MTSRRSWLGFPLGLVLLLCPVLAVPAADAQGITVDYLDGKASQRAGAAWSVLSIGDSVPLEASVKLEDRSLLQLKAAGATITLSHPGTYAVKDLLVSGASLRAAGVGSALAAAFSKILHGPGRSMGSPGGVRAETVDGAAPTRFPVETEEEQLAVIATAYAQDGDARRALASLTAISPTGTEEWASDYVLLKARLLEDTFAFAPAVELLLGRGAELSADETRAPTWLFLLALGYKGLGDPALERACLDKVVSMAPGGDLAAAAERLLENP